jgi:hypothetical protein
MDRIAADSKDFTGFTLLHPVEFNGLYDLEP